MNIRRVIPFLLLLLLPAVALAGLEAIKTDPEDGSTVSRPPRSLRVWFDAEPKVSASELELHGPDGELELQGLHTMGEKDLMVRVVGRMPNGTYTAKWRTEGEDGEKVSGEWSFDLERGASRESH